MKKKALLFCLVISVGLISCDSNSPGELNGQVFIVTKGADSVKLGLVEVTAIPEKDVVAFIAKKKAGVDKEKDALKKKYEAANKAYFAALDRTNKAMTFGACEK